MKKTVTKKAARLLSLLLAVSLCASSNLTTAFAQTAQGESSNSVKPVTVSSSAASGTMNLTETGSLDWAHMTRETINRKSGVDPALITIAQLNPGDGLTTMTDCPVAYSWSDGSVDQTVSNNTKGAVYNWRNGQADSVNVDITEDAGYKISIPSADYPRTLTFVSGVWNSEASISVYANGGSVAVYTNTELKAGGSVVNKKYVLNVRSGNSIEVVCKMTKKSHAYGNLNLSAVALGKMEIPDAVKVDIQAASGSMNLTQMGDLDWVHLTGLTNNSSTSRLITTRKAGVTPQIAFETLKDNDITTRQTDSKVSYTWTDGVSDGGDGYAAMTGSTLGGVMNWHNGQTDSIGNLPAATEAGYRISVPAAGSARKLTFVSGVWQSQGVISISLNGDTTPVYSVDLQAGSGAVANIYTVSLSASDSAVVEFKLKSKTAKSGNIAIGAITLGSDANGINFKQKLADLVKSAEGFDTTDVDKFFVAQFNAELANSKAVLQSADATNETYYEAYTYLKSSYDTLQDNATGRTYTYDSASGLTSSFGWEGDKDAPIAYVDGSYKLRDHGNLMINFGVWNIPGKIAWYNKEGYLPCFVSKYEKDGLRHVVENFSDLVAVNGNNYEIAYSRMTTTNTSAAVMNLPKVSGELIPLNGAAANTLTVQPGETVVRDYAIGADRFGNSYAYPEDSVIVDQGSWDTHYTHMKNYWNARLEPLAEITKLPDEKLINAYKAGYIYTLIIADGSELHVGENGYDRVWDHDVIGIISTLITIGDYTNVKQYLPHILDNVQYPDARWKYSWPFALYLQKTGDSAYIKSMFDTIKANTHYIETERTGNGGIMKNTNAIDSDGSWLIDDWAALQGLTTYQYICDTLYTETNDMQYKTESDWAKQQYTELLAATEKAQAAMREKYSYPYLSIDMTVPTEQSARSDVRDANWASMFLFGRWAWDGYLFGANQTNSQMISLIDDTYTHGFARRSGITDTIYNFGGYPHGYFSSAYNAGYGSAALRGEEYRDAGIKAYEFMIDKAMSGPFSWWEGVRYPSDSSPWDIDHAAGGGGSCQHMWGQSTATKVLFDSLIAAKADGTAIIGRGVPKEWIADGQEIEVKDYPVNDNARMGFNINTKGKTVTLTLTGDNSKTPVSLELLAFKDNISKADNFAYDNATGVVTVPAGTKTVTVELKNGDGVNTEALTALIAKCKAMNSDSFTAASWGKLQNALADANTVLADAGKTAEQVQAAIDQINQAVNSLIAQYRVTVGKTANGTVTADKANVAAGEQIILTVKPDNGYVVDSVKMNGTALTAKNGVYSFTMPAENATVAVAFKKLPAGKVAQLVETRFGITVEGENGTVFDQNMKLVVEESDKKVSDLNGQKLIKLFDISILQNGIKIQPDGKVRITIKIPAECSNYTDLRIVYVDDTGKTHFIPSTINGDTITFTAEHFSLYGIVGTPKSSSQPNSTGDSADSPQTGDTLPVVPIALAMLVCTMAVGFVVLCRKKYLHNR